MKDSIKQKSNIQILSGFYLKLIAILTMTIDHVGAVMYSESNGGLVPDSIYEPIRIIGRIAFPIFCYMLVEGFVHTSSKTKYAIRLLSFAIISQLPYSLAIYHRIQLFERMNIFFTLLLAFALLCFIDICIKKLQLQTSEKQLYLVFAFLAIMLCLSFVDNYGFSYHKYGILLVLIFYFFRIPDEKFKEDRFLLLYTLVQVALAMYISNKYSSDTQIYCALAFIFILMYNRQKGPGMKYFFYLYYPVHLLVIYGLYLLFTQ